MRVGQVLYQGLREESACVRAALQPWGRRINKVTVQLQSWCIHSTAVYKADGDTTDLKKNKISGGGGQSCSRSRKHIMTFSFFPLKSFNITTLTHTYIQSFMDEWLFPATVYVQETGCTYYFKIRNPSSKRHTPNVNVHCSDINK